MRRTSSTSSSTNTQAASGSRLGLLLVVLPLAVTAACATPGHYERELASWVGQDVGDLVHSWGPPSESRLLADGKTLLLWSRDESYTRPVPTKSITYGYTVEASLSARVTVPAWCDTTFTVAPSGQILSWHREGNRCTAR